MAQKHPLGVEKVTPLVPFISKSNPWGVNLQNLPESGVLPMYTCPPPLFSFFFNKEEEKREEGEGGNV